MGQNWAATNNKEDAGDYRHGSKAEKSRILGTLICPENAQNSHIPGYHECITTNR